jgi:hypothetical protein
MTGTGAHRAPPIPHRRSTHRRVRPVERWFAPDWFAENYPWFIWPVLALLTGFFISIVFFTVVNGDYSDQPPIDPPSTTTGSRHP